MQETPALPLNADFVPALRHPAGPYPSWRWWRRAAFLLVCLGLAWRLVRYLLRFPLFGDEALLALNLLEHDPGFFRRLDYGQIAPPLFFWAQTLLYQTLGASEWVLRLIPLVASLASLPLFWWLARQLLPCSAACLAIALLAVSSAPAHLGSLFKPYSVDLLMTVVLMTLAVGFHKSRGGWPWLAGLCLIAPVALTASLTAVFSAATIGIAVLPTLWRHGRWQTWLIHGVFGILVLGTFGLVQAGLARDVPEMTHTAMSAYWARGFPPGDPLRLGLWLLEAHCGEMVAYPLGSQRGGSVLTTLLVGLALWRAWRRRQTFLLLLCVTPFFLGLAAAGLERYPYGIGARINQHLAPAVCLLAGLGLSVVLRGLARMWLLCPHAMLACLALIPLAGMTRDVLRPYREPVDPWLRGLGHRLAQRLRPRDTLVLVNPRLGMNPALRWYLANAAPACRWIDDQPTPAGDVYFLHFRPYNAGDDYDASPAQARTVAARLPERYAWRDDDFEEHRYEERRLRLAVEIVRQRLAAAENARGR